MQLDVDPRVRKRLPLWAGLCIMAGSLLCVLLFDRFGKFDLARPAVYSALVFGFVLAAKWKLKNTRGFGSQ